MLVAKSGGPGGPRKLNAAPIPIRQTIAAASTNAKPACDAGTTVHHARPIALNPSSAVTTAIPTRERRTRGQINRQKGSAKWPDEINIALIPQMPEVRTRYHGASGDKLDCQTIRNCMKSR